MTEAGEARGCGAPVNARRIVGGEGQLTAKYGVAGNANSELKAEELADGKL
jgi:hypothetical protein